MEEVEGLSVAAIDLVMKRVSGYAGLSRGNFKSDAGGVCALGAVGIRDDPKKMDSETLGRCLLVGLLKNTFMFSMTVAASTIATVNDQYPGTGEERKAHVLAWLQAQRDLKCCDWTPPARELSADERRKTVLL